MTTQRRYGAFAIRRPTRGTARRLTAVHRVLALKPQFSYRPVEPNITRFGFAIQSLANEVNPGSNWQLDAGSAAERPAWLTSSSLPSGVPALQGDATDDALYNDSITGIGDFQASGTIALLGYRTSAVIFPCGGLHSAGAAPWYLGSFSNGFKPSARRGAVEAQGATHGANTPFWAISTCVDAGALTVLDDTGATDSQSEAGSAAYTGVHMCCRRVSGANSVFSQSEIAWFVGWPRVLSAWEIGVVAAAFNEYGGL